MNERDLYEEIVPRSPLEVCMPFATKMTYDRAFDSFDWSESETDAAFEMNFALQNLGLIKPYDVRASLTLILPEDITPDDEGNVIVHKLFHETNIVGDLKGARVLKIGRIVGGQSVRAVCLAFEDTLIKYRTAIDTQNGRSVVIPLFDKVQSTDEVYIPVFAVQEIAEAS